VVTAVELFLSSSLIAMRTSVTVFHTVRTCRRSQKIGDVRAWAPPLVMGHD